MQSQRTKEDSHMYRYRNMMTLAVALVSMTLLTGGLFSKGYESSKSKGGYTITLKADKYPLIRGDNELSIAVADRSGKTVPGAAVEARYYMPPMPGMAPMDYRTKTAEKGGEYAFLANIPMEGGWKVEVWVTPATGKTVSATFNLDAR